MSMHSDNESLPFGYLYEQVKVHADDRGTEHPYEECELQFPSYTAMTTAMKEYYLWWRTNLLEGRYLKANEAYVKLFIYESIALGRDPSGLLKQLELVNNGNDVSRFVLHPLAMDLCIHAKLPYPDWMRYVSDDLLLFFRGCMLSSPERFHIPVYMALDMPFPEYYPDDELELGIMLNHALRAIDRHLRETTGRGLVATVSEEEIRFGYQPFGGYDIPGCGPKVLRYHRFGNYATNMLNGIYAYCFKKLFDYGPRVPSDFPKELRSVIDSLPEDLTVWDNPETVMPNVEDSDGTENVGALVPMLDVEYIRVSQGFFEDLRAHREISVDGPLRYVPSGFWTPDYRHMSDRSREYYLYWRTCVRRERYPPTDLGYLWLYCCELANTWDRPQETLDGFYRLTRAYCSNMPPGEVDGWGFNRYSVRRLCMEYAICHGLKIPATDLYRCDASGCLTFAHFLDTGETPPDEKLLIAITGLKKNQSGPVDRDVAAVTGRVLLRLNRESKKGLLSDGRVRKKQIKERVFGGLQFHGYGNGSNLYTVSVPNLFAEGYWHENIRDLLLATVAYVRMYRGTSKKKPEPCVCFGKGLDGIIEEEVKKYFRPAPVAKEVHLDLSKVDDAQKGLDEVTGMMAVSEQEQPVEEVPVKPKRGRPKKVKAVEPEPVSGKKVPAAETVVGDTAEPSDDNGLRSRLDRFQTEYLRALWEEPAACPFVLRLSGMSRGRMEDSINEIALETVGDTLVDGGEIVREYLGTVKRLFM
ncbi:MAG: TerB N-terminal domain-containing protein [archaeon]|nr:TerB N-terminal domain-containing protein [archaeon]